MWLMEMDTNPPVRGEEGERVRLRAHGVHDCMIRKRGGRDLRDLRGSVLLGRWRRRGNLMGSRAYWGFSMTLLLHPHDPRSSTPRALHPTCLPLESDEGDVGKTKARRNG